MTRWKLKGCPRCSGDLNIIFDNLGYYEDCLQCGYHHYYDDHKSRNNTKKLELSAISTDTWSGENLNQNLS